MESRFGHDFSRVPSGAQPKHGITQPGDNYEREADRLAEDVMRAPEPRRQRGPDPEAKGFSGVDFSRVRVHANARAAEAAQSLGARAFTYGRDIFFAQGEYAPQTAGGRKLLAHELAHVAQQSAAGEPMVARQLEQYETKPTVFTGADIETAAKGSYWEQKVFAAYSTSFVNPVSTRLAADAEERDAVLSTLWNVRPTPLTTETVRLVTIPKRTGVASSKVLAYQFTFTPKPPKSKPGVLDQVKIKFVSEGAAAASSAAPPPAAAYKASSHGLSFGGFPGNDIDAYWKAHPEEQRQVFNFIDNVAPDPFDQIITTEVSPPAGSKALPQKASFQVKGSKTGGSVQDLEIKFLGALPTTEVKPPAGYNDKDRLDLKIEELQTTEHKTKKDKLGAISGLDKLPADEKAPVKYVIWQYFGNGTRNAEVDAVVPVMTTGRRIFYTLRFKSGNDVEVERVAEEGTGAGKMSLTGLDVARARGFKDNSADPAALTTWLKKRYPSVTPTGKTVEELRQSANTNMQAEAGKPNWFKKNYDLTVLPQADGQTRLQTTHGIPAALTADVKDFTSKDLNVFEFALQTMTDAFLALVKGVRLIRKTLGFVFDGATKKYKPDADLSGLALQKGSDKSIAIFDKATQGDEHLFLGGKGGVRQEATMTAAHEFGHIVEEQAGIKKAFGDFVKKNNIKPVTWYAAKQPADDFFTEAFALYHTDPEWMKTNLPLLHAWFEQLGKTGTPPPP